MAAPDETTSKTMRLRYPGTCSACSAELAAGTRAVYDRATKTVACIACEAAGPAVAADHASEVVQGLVSAPEDAVEGGVAGASARREHERRKARREARIRDAHPRLGGLILALSDDPQSTKAWERGAVGEEKLAKRLDGLADHGVRMVHDRRIPRTRANIDHIAVAPAGVFVIDAKRYAGRPHLRVEGGLFRPRTERLFVGSRDCTKLVDGVKWQLEQVTAALATVPDLAVAPVVGMLCFVGADWPLIGGAFTTDGVRALWPRKAAERLSQPGPLTAADVDAIHSHLAALFPPA